MLARFALVAALVQRAEAWGYCNDNDISCAKWANNGECDGSNKETVKKLCPHSCSLCDHLCRDIEEGCAGWAAGGQCTENADFMTKNCPTSCGDAATSETRRRPGAEQHRVPPLTLPVARSRRQVQAQVLRQG